MDKFKLVLEKEEGYTYDEYKVTSPESLASAANGIFDLSRQTEELLVVLGFDSKGKVISATELARGSMTSTIIHPRELFKRLFVSNCRSFALAHNHPSGDPSPSKSDRIVTQEILKASKLLDIEFHDHIIIGHNEDYFSLRANNMFEEMIEHGFFKEFGLDEGQD